MATLEDNSRHKSQQFHLSSLEQLELKTDVRTSSSLTSASVDSGVAMDTSCITMDTALGDDEERATSVLSTDSGVTQSADRPLSSSPTNLLAAGDRSSSVGITGKTTGSKQRRPPTTSRSVCSGPTNGMNRPDTTARPASALARGVQIVEYHDAAVQRLNPEPIANAMEESLVLMEEYLCPRKLVRLCVDDLRALTGIDDLDKVHYLEMRVDTRDTSLGNFGFHVPNLAQLKLSNSIISSLRDLGSSLDNVRVLWMARCSTVDLDGVASLCNLRELYVAYNDIVDISPCSLLENIQIIDLEGNNINDIIQVEFLALCQELRCLTLEGNPVCSKPDPTSTVTDYDYRSSVKHILPRLGMLDDEPLTDDQQNSRPSSVFDDDWKLIDELVLEGMMLPDDNKVEDLPGRPSTAWSQSLPYRPGSALKPQTACRSTTGSRGMSPRLGSSDSGRPSTSSRTRSADSTAIIDDIDPTCELTTGSVVCGNLSRALKSRKRDDVEVMTRKAEKFLAQFDFKPEHTYDTVLEDDEKVNSIVEELRVWKEQHQKRIAEIDASRAPQILKIDYDDTVDISPDTDSDSSVMSDEDVAIFSEPVLPSSMTSETAVLPTLLDSLAPQNRLPSITSTGVTRRPDVAQEDAVLQKVKSKRVSKDAFSAESLSSDTLRHSAVNPGDTLRHSAVNPGDTLRHSAVSSDDTVSADSLRHSANALSVARGAAGGVPAADAWRPISGPVPSNRGKFKLDPVVDKTQHKNIDPLRPVVRGSTTTPEGPRVPDPARVGTSRAALGQTGSIDSLSRGSSVPGAPGTSAVRRGQLFNMQLLPSKFK